MTRSHGVFSWVGVVTAVAVSCMSAWAVADEVTLTQLETKPEVWHLEPEASWEFTTTQTDDDAMVIHQVGPVKTRPVRRPYTYAILKDRRWQQATIDLEVKSLEPLKKKGRDVCILLGYVDDTHFTYVHLSNDADGKTHNIIMKVEGDKRRVIHEPKKPETRLTAEGWQNIRVRFDQDGRIEVFHVDMDEPLMTATDRDIVGKPTGVGSFNDRAAFKAIEVTGQAR